MGHQAMCRSVIENPATCNVDALIDCWNNASPPGSSDHSLSTSPATSASSPPSLRCLNRNAPHRAAPASTASPTRSSSTPTRRRSARSAGTATSATCCVFPSRDIGGYRGYRDAHLFCSLPRRNRASPRQFAAHSPLYGRCRSGPLTFVNMLFTIHLRDSFFRLQRYRTVFCHREIATAAA